MRDLVDDEHARFEELLVEHGIEGALVVAFNFAMNLTDDDERLSAELRDRALARLWEACSWSPHKDKPLGVVLCGLVRSEKSRDPRDDATRHEYEEAHATEEATLGGTHVKSPEEMALELEEADEARQKALGELEPLRREFVKAKDKTNLLWMKLRLEGYETPAEMAAVTGIDVKELYRAKDRRDRLVKRLLAAKRGKPQDDEENG